MIRAQLMYFCDWYRVARPDVLSCGYPNYPGTAYFGDAPGEVTNAFSSRTLPGMDSAPISLLEGSSAWIRGAGDPAAQPYQATPAIAIAPAAVQQLGGCGCSSRCASSAVPAENMNGGLPANVLPGQPAAAPAAGLQDAQAWLQSSGATVYAPGATTARRRRFPWALLVLALLVGVAMGDKH